jgi:hypothetical protein
MGWRNQPVVGQASCHALPTPATNPARHFLRHLLPKTRYVATKQRFGTILLGELWLFLKVAGRSRRMTLVVLRIGLFMGMPF